MSLRQLIPAIVAVICIWSMARAVRAVPLPAHIYDLNGSLKDTMGGPPLIDTGGFLSDARFEFFDNGGLRLEQGFREIDTYSIGFCSS